MSPNLAPPEVPPAVAIIDSGPGQGDFIAVWQSLGQDGDGLGVYAQIFDETGAAATDAFLVNTTTIGNQLAPSVGSDGNGNFVIAWQGEDQVNGGYDVFYSQGSYVANTLTLGTETRANTLLTAGNQLAPTVAVDGSGNANFVIAWQGEDTAQPLLGFDIYAKRGSVSGGLAAGDEFLVNTTNTTGDQLAPTAAMGPTGNSNFLIAWQGPAPAVGTEEGSVEIWGKLYDSTGAAITTDEFQVNAGGVRDQIAPAAAMNASGAFVVGWQAEGQEGSGSDVYARRFDAAASPLDAADQLINQTVLAPQRAPAVAIDAAGNVLTAWQSSHQDGFSWGIYARRYDAGTGTFGAEFLVNDLIQSGPQTNPAMAMTGTGRVVLAWLGPEVPDIGAEEGEGGHKPGVHARLFDDAGGLLAGSEFLLNTYSAAEDAPAAAAADAAGNYVVVWQSWEDTADGSGFGIYAKLFQSNGAPIDLNGNGIDDDAMLVNTTTLSSQSNPSVASDAAGNFVVVWQSALQDGDGYGIFARKFNGYTKDWAGAEFQVNVTTVGDQTTPKVAMDGAGSFTVVWESADADGSGIFARKFNADGTPAPGGEFQINTATDTDQVAPSIAMNAAGQFVVAWVSSHNVANDPLDSEKSIFARWFNAAGVASGPEFLVNTYAKDAQEHPSVGIDKNGNFVVAWQSINQEMNVEGIGQSWGVYARQFTVSSTGVVTPKQAEEFRVNETADGSQRFPTVGMDQNGQFIVVWQSIPQDGSSWAVYGRQYRADGTAEGPEARINTYTSGPQILPVVAERGSGDFGVFWSGQGSGHVDGVFGQRFHWIRDDFNKGYQPSLGPDWTVRLGDFDIHDNQAVVVSKQGFATLNQVSLRNVSVEAYVTLGGGVVQVQGLVARHQGTSNSNMYYARIYGSEGVFKAEILRNLNGVWTVLASNSVSVGAGLLRFDVVRSSLKLFLNDQLVASAYDTAIRDAGKIGIRGNWEGSADNFTYTPLDPIAAVLPFRDSFNLTTGASLSPFWSEQAGSFTVLNKKLAGTGSINLASLYGVTAANVSVEAVVDVTAGQYAGLVARHQGVQATNMYVGQLVNVNGSYFARINMNVNGVWTRLAQVAVGSGTGRLRFEAVGTSLKLYLDGTLVASAVDSTFTADGQIGLLSSNGTTLDDFNATTL